ncbi:YdiU family protein [Spongiibacter taiwanensis]|uniref:protein adenylyltransferase SelO n=1 Tax=Spongiibacter taiwanensis TaxID=1748242 RepID=UPI002034AD78|nr:YdiU family protein [Spongiibacter taiwanensis]USA43865.1 YdiU family protein [Spongiibacter taiwanensis]
MTPIAFDNSYAKLSDRFYSPLSPAQVPAPAWIACNTELAKDVGIDPQWLASDAGLAMAAGNQLPAGAEPIATVYAGHQFGSYNPQLGDGRAVLLGEVIRPDGQRVDVQLKGAGRTPYSRGGDGKSPLGPVLREYLLSEAMYALGVPTTRALAAVSTGEPVYREQALPGAILTRVAKSHLRIGTFQFFAARQDHEALSQLVDYTINRHYPAATQAAIPALALFESVVAAQAELIAQWQSLGFIHGVMNTDNMLLSGETIDYGPCAFMEAYHPGKVFSSIDSHGRYAFGNQPAIGQWNLAQLAQALLPLLDEDPNMAVEMAQQALNEYPDKFFAAYHQRMAAKLGISQWQAGDEQLYQDFLDLLAEHQCDFTLAFRRLFQLAHPEYEAPLSDLFAFPEAFTPWLSRWQGRRDGQPDTDESVRRAMLQANPLFIPRNHRVEQAIHAATWENNLAPFQQLLAVVTQPFDARTEWLAYAAPASPDEAVQRTFCGT